MTMVILGLDPGLCRTGWAIISSSGVSQKILGWGVIKVPTKLALANRLCFLHTSICTICQQYNPTEAAVEEVFVNANSSSSLRLGMARGVVMMTPALMGCSIFEYAATTIKKSVTGSGHATKEQVAAMTAQFFPNLSKQPILWDASDAMATALCHDHHRWQNALSAKSR
jgi:crossover junction endodeoxyribonuclease RuvC